jgi:hypothetical protein
VRTSNPTELFKINNYIYIITLQLNCNFTSQIKGTKDETLIHTKDKSSRGRMPENQRETKHHTQREDKRWKP